jgi:hypothetical protein
MDLYLISGKYGSKRLGFHSDLLKGNKMTLAILYQEELKEYDFGPGHPFRETATRSFPNSCRKTSGKDHYQFLQAEGAKEEDLFLICGREIR